MALINEAFSIPRGDDRLIEIEVRDSNGVLIDLSTPGTKIRLTYGKSGAGKALVARTEQDLTVAGTLASYRMRPTETSAFEADRTYWIQARVTFPDGSTDGFRETVLKGSFTVEETQD